MDIKKKIPQRSHSGEFRLTNKTNKKYLVEDFEHRCGYCDDHDRFIGGDKNYHVEHFAPKERFPQLKTIYDNLLYSCPFCNIAKSNKWPGKTEKENIVGNEGFIDPCNPDYKNHLFREKSGKIAHKTLLGEYIYNELNFFLCRHELLYQLDIIMSKIIEVREKMKDGRISEIRRKKLVELEKLLCSEFMTYYLVFCETN